MTLGRGHRRGLGAGILACFFASAITACGGNSGDVAHAVKTSQPPEVAAAKAKLNELYHGTYEAPPTSAPKAPPGKNVWLISVAQNAGPPALAMQAARRAAKDFGWKATVFDGKGDPNTMLTGVRAAMVAKADGIFIYSIDCPYVTAGLEQAKRAGIPAVAAESADCSELKPGAPSLFTYSVHYAGNTPFLQFLEDWGAAQATWYTAKLDGKAKIIEFKETDLASPLASARGFEKELSKCGGCRVVETVDFAATDLGPKLQEKAQQALLQHPEANGVEVPYDGVMTLGVSAALRASGRLSKMQIMGGEGNAANMDMIRQRDGQDAGVGVPSQWEGWSGMDALNRIFNHEPPVSSGIGLQIFDRDHNLPAHGPFVPMMNGKPIDYAGLYENAFTGA